MSELELLAGTQQQGETIKAVQACNDFLRLGVGRSLGKLAEKYAKISQSEPPTKNISTLKKWSASFDWQARAAEFDASWDERKTAERKAVMDYGLSLDYERVTKLKELADFLESQLYETDDDGNLINLWLPDVKGIGSKEDFERVDIERFNSALLSQYRGVLDDLAKEVGGRVNRQDITSDGNPIPIAIINADPDDV